MPSSQKTQTGLDPTLPVMHPGFLRSSRLPILTRRPEDDWTLSAFFCVFHAANSKTWAGGYTRAGFLNFRAPGVPWLPGAFLSRKVAG